ncbi:MAG: hemolysin III family protein [Actinomycetaceae bacterium]|nr:hemolysin III family protein [Actinomycetaceae bacterium]
MNVQAAHTHPNKPFHSLDIEEYIKPKLRGWIHLVITPLSLAASIVLIAIAPGAANKWSCAVFLICTVLLFGVSSVYHRIDWGKTAENLLRRWDHSNIFLLIAGTYTPITVALLDSHDMKALLVLVWSGAIGGILLSILWPTAPRWIYVPIYILLGWVAVYYMGPLSLNGGMSVVWLLVAGGVAYTIGGIVYGLKKPDPFPQWFGFHEIFHLFTVIGWICHCITAYLAVLTK